MIFWADELELSDGDEINGYFEAIDERYVLCFVIPLPSLERDSTDKPSSIGSDSTICPGGTLRLGDSMIVFCRNVADKKLTLH